MTLSTKVLVRTGAELEADVRMYADIGTSAVVSTAEIYRMLTESMANLWDLIIENNGQEYIHKYVELTTSPGVAVVALPIDFYKLTGVDVVVAGQSYPIRPYMNIERHARAPGSWASLSPWADSGVRYRLFGAISDTGQAQLLSESGGEGYPTTTLSPFQIRFEPTPTTAHTVRVWYIPLPPDVTLSTDNLPQFNSWLEWVVYDTVVRLKDLMEIETSGEMLRLARLTDRIVSHVSARDQGFPDSVQDVERTW